MARKRRYALGHPGGLLVAGALALLACLAAATPASAAPAWLSPTDLSAPLRDASHVRVAMDGAGNGVAVWEKDSGVVSHYIQASLRATGGGFSAPVDLALQAQDPDLTMTPGGEAIAVWSHLVNPPGIHVIQASIRPPGGSFSAPLEVASLGTLSETIAPRVAANANGDVAVVWTQANEGGKRVVNVSTMAAGGAFSTPVTLSDPAHDASEPQVAVNAAGQASVVWSQALDEGEPERIRLASGAGASFSAPEDVASAEHATGPQVAVGPGGEPTVVWRSVPSKSAPSVIETRSRKGGSLSPPVQLSDPGRGGFQPEIAIAPGGLATVVWSEEDAEAVFRIEASTGSPGGPFSSPVPLSGSERNAFNPEPVVNGAGASVVVWKQLDVAGNYIAEASTGLPGGAFSDPVGLSASGQDTVEPRVAIDAAGDATAVWARSNGSNTIAQAAGYDADPPALRNLSIPASGTVGIPVSFSVEPFDVWPIKSTKFDFGDGEAANGAAVSHAYASYGTFHVTVTTVDAGGTATTASGTISILASNRFTLAKLKRNKKAGRATVVVDVPGPGKLTLSGKGVKKAVRTSRAAGPISLPVAPQKRTLKKLDKRHKARVKLTIVFAPVGGAPATQHLSLTLIKKP